MTLESNEHAQKKKQKQKQIKYCLTESFYGAKKVREKSRECHNNNPQPFQDTKTNFT